MTSGVRVSHPRQQGARLSWYDSLFELVQPVRPEPPAFVDTIPQPIVTELDGWPPLIKEGAA